jgi:hypothetical protein
MAKIPGLGKAIPGLSNIKGIDQLLGAVTKLNEVSRATGLNKIQGIRDLLP